MINIYLGSGFFTEGNCWQANKVEQLLKEQIDKLGLPVDIYNPANNMEINDKENGFASGSQILKADLERLNDSSILIALLDGQDVGLAFEMGYAFGKNIPIFQLHTDSRLLGNRNQDKITELQKDVFQNDFMYVNKLLTASSYVMDDNARFKDIEPRIYTNKEELVNQVINHIQKTVTLTGRGL